MFCEIFLNMTKNYLMKNVRQQTLDLKYLNTCDVNTSLKSRNPRTPVLCSLMWLDKIQRYLIFTPLLYLQISQNTLYSMKLQLNLRSADWKKAVSGAKSPLRKMKEKWSTEVAFKHACWHWKKLTHKKLNYLNKVILSLQLNRENNCFTEQCLRLYHAKYFIYNFISTHMLAIKWK